MIKYFVFCDESNDLFLDIFKIDVEKDIFIDYIREGDEFSLDEEYLQSFLTNDDFCPPSHYIYSSDELFENIEDAKKYRSHLINGGDFI